MTGTDIALFWSGGADALAQGADIALDGADLSRARDLATAAIVSLLSWRRAEPDDRLPDDTGDRRGWWGWWGDTYLAGGDRIGSRLWLLHREKITAETIERARQYCREALQWMLDDGAARDVIVSLRRDEAHGLFTVAGIIEIVGPDGTRVDIGFDRVWRQIEGQGI